MSDVNQIEWFKEEALFQLCKGEARPADIIDWLVEKITSELTQDGMMLPGLEPQHIDLVMKEMRVTSDTNVIRWWNAFQHAFVSKITKGETG